MPTLRSVSSEFVPCVVAIYRDIMRDYASSSYEQRNQIWNRTLSAMKHSLATVRHIIGKKRRRRPVEIQETTTLNSEAEQKASDLRAIKKATRLLLEGATKKGTRVLDQETATTTMTDEGKLDQLRKLHPSLPISFALPTDAPKIACLPPQELRDAGKRLAKGSAPGPSGTTEAIVRLLLDDEICCSSLCHMICDLVNGMLSKEVMRRLRRARLVALPKTSKSVRPVAMGEVLLKLAGLVLILRHEHKFAKLFLPMQHGVMSQAGCETIVHELNRRYMEGHAILSLDMKNAFNSPSRDDIAKAIFAFSALRPFQRLFVAEYGEPSELLFYGKNGELFSKVESSAGVRQGSPLSTLYFCTFLQPILETIAQEFPSLNIYAYVDDINISSHDVDLIASAYVRLKELLESKSIRLAPQKCVWFDGLNNVKLPEKLVNEGVQIAEKAVKVLGAYLGGSTRVSELLLNKLEKHRAIFRRLKTMGANNISMLLLSRCVNVRHRYHIRVHRPEETFEMAKSFDKEVQEVLTTWFGEMNPKQIAWARLPVKSGGLGLTPTDLLRKSAYEASRHNAFERLNSLSVRATGLTSPSPVGNEDSIRPPNDEFVTEAQLNKSIKESLSKDPNVASLLRAASEKGNSSWIQSNAKLVSSKFYTLALIPRLGLSHPRLPGNLQCPGCRVILESSSALSHIAGCVQCSGNNATTKHDALVRRIYDLCMKAGVPCEREPRQFTTYKCSTCGESFPHWRKREHQQICRNASLHRSGPDIVIYWASGEVFYDLTVIHELAPSNLRRGSGALMRDAIARKHNTYVASGMIPQERFKCIPVLSGGAMHQGLKTLLHTLADCCGLERGKTLNEFSLHLQELNGSVVFSQLKNYLTQETSQELGL